MREGSPNGFKDTEEFLFLNLNGVSTVFTLLFLKMIAFMHSSRCMIRYTSIEVMHTIERQPQNACMSGSSSPTQLPLAGRRADPCLQQADSRGFGAP